MATLRVPATRWICCSGEDDCVKQAPEVGSTPRPQVEDYPAAMRLTAEFTSEPFVGEDETPSHALAARDAAQRAGLNCNFGPFGTSVTGEDQVLLPALARVLEAALRHGATRVTLQVERVTEG
jgi:uncharacterized protein YqgV (UPF0045/DUF77 family)